MTAQLENWVKSAVIAAIMAVSVMSSPAMSQVAPSVTLQPEKFLTRIDGKPVGLYTIRNPKWDGGPHHELRRTHRASVGP